MSVVLLKGQAEGLEGRGYKRSFKVNDIETMNDASYQYYNNQDKCEIHFLIDLQYCKECILRDFHTTQLFHSFFSGFLLF